MPIATLPTRVKLYYTDSGKPSEPDYDTIVIVHGVAYNGGTLILPSSPTALTSALFSPLNAVLPNNLRIIAYNQRGYRRSTPLKRGELNLTSPPDMLAVEYTIELADFLNFIAYKHWFPRKPIVLGWSKGTNLLIGLASPTFLPPEFRHKGLSKISAMIMFEAPGNAFGLVPTEDYTTAMMGAFPDGTSEGEKKAITAQRFSNWISGFYQHQNLDSDTPIYGVEPTGFSADTLDNQLLARASEPAMVPLGFHWTLSSNAKQREKYAREAIEQKDVPIAMAWNGETAGYIVSAAKAGESMGAKVYKLDDKGNHLVFAHEPKKFLDGICKVASDLTGHTVGNPVDE